MSFPWGARFAFTILDDTDVATVENVAPVYRLLDELGLRATKTVWPLAGREPGSPFAGSQTLEDAEYRDFVIDLRRRGFEITWHGAAMDSSERKRTLEGLARFRAVLGEAPRIHANHATNRENLYWGAGRVDDRIVRAVARRASGLPEDHYQGHAEGSAYWWGDACLRHIDYARNLTFDAVNLMRINPSMPYRDPRRPLARWWFSAADAEDRAEFVRLLESGRQARLEAEGGVCIVATHFAKGFVRGGEVDPAARRVLEELARRRGWFPTVGELLDRLRDHGAGGVLPAAEWRRMQRAWVLGLARRSWRRRRRRGGVGLLGGE
ncbi:MAG TPA: hypothetical protein VFQ38_03755 [Longimicrobiales bacterium]|nr:hypothetical protein [Longimicrobiales bacterium]